MTPTDLLSLSSLFIGFIWGRFFRSIRTSKLKRLTYRWNAVSKGWTVGSPYRQLGSDYRLGMSDCAHELLKELGEK